jgi:hypothetical protein
VRFLPRKAHRSAIDSDYLMLHEGSVAREPFIRRGDIVRNVRDDSRPADGQLAPVFDAPAANGRVVADDGAATDGDRPQGLVEIPQP